MIHTCHETQFCVCFNIKTMSWKHLEDESVRESFYRFPNVGSLLVLQDASILQGENKNAELQLGWNFLVNTSFTEKKSQCGLSTQYVRNKLLNSIICVEFWILILRWHFVPNRHAFMLQIKLETQEHGFTLMSSSLI